MGRKRKEDSGSEHEDDPEPFEASGSDPEFDVEEEKSKQTGRRKSSRAVKKSKKSFKEESGTDEEEPENEEDSDDEEAPKKKRKTPAKKGGKAKAASPKAKKPPAKKAKEDSEEGEGEEDEVDEEENEEDEEENNKNGSADSDSSQGNQGQSRGIHRKFIPKTIYSEDYATGSFVILKKDAHTGAEKHPCIWRIDGKALLQKYEAFDEEEKVRHKNTSIYTGWSPLDKDLYAPITVDVVRHNNNNLTVEVHWDKLKEIEVEEDE